jgi:hypothetical protein
VSARPAIVAALALASLIASPAHAQLDAQISSRLFLGGGAEFPRQRDTAAVVDFGARAEVLIGDAAANRFRLGPAIDLRTATFRTFEAAGGLALLLPLGFDFAIEATIAAGFAARPGGHDGGIGVLTLRAAYQPYDHFDCYSHGVAIYVSGRAGLDGETWEATAGLEIDFEFLVATPLVYVITALSGHDPDEPEGPG